MKNPSPEKPVVLTLADFYLPGFRAGGPITTLANMVEKLGDDYDFRIVTRDRDLGDTSPYPEVTRCGEWLTLGRARVCYLPVGKGLSRSVRQILRQDEHDLLYLNSFYSLPFSIAPLWEERKRTRGKPILIAPRGELAAGALKLKPHRKSLFLKVAKLLRLHRNIVWQASSPFEEQDIRRQFGDQVRVIVAPDVSSAPSNEILASPVRPKQAGTLRALFVSRISPVKNLKAVFESFQEARGEVELDIAGPIEDDGYWRECQAAASRMPSGVRWRYLGVIPAREIRSLIRGYDLSILPTFGENYGHVVVESLSVGTPVLISDRTPWRDLTAAGAGWDLPLDRPELFRQAIADCVSMSQREHERLRFQASEYWRQRIYQDDSSLEKNRAMLDEALHGKRSGESGSNTEDALDRMISTENLLACGAR